MLAPYIPFRRYEECRIYARRKTVDVVREGGVYSPRGLPRSTVERGGWGMVVSEVVTIEIQGEVVKRSWRTNCLVFIDYASQIFGNENLRRWILLRCLY